MISFLYHCQDFNRILLYIRVKRLELLTFREHMRSAVGFFMVLLVFLVFCVVLVCVVSLHFEFHVVMSVTISALKTMFGSSLPPVFCRWVHVYLRDLCLPTYSGVKHILCCVFVLLVFVLCTLCCQFLWIVHL